MEIEVKSFPASNGESFLIKVYGSSVTNILIDCGYVSTTKFIIEEIEEIQKNNQKLDLIILTHIDNDHINGARKILKYLIENKIDIGEILYNDYLKIFEGDSSEKNIPKDIEDFMNTLAQVEYKNELGIIKKEEVGFNSATCVTEYLNKNELYSKWNKSFEQKSVHVDGHDFKILVINDEVSITVLGPNKSVLDEVLNEWQDYLIKFVNKEIKVKSITVAKAFEKYFVALRNIAKKINRNQCSSDDIDDMLKYSDYDTDNINRSSISVVIECSDKKMMFLGDSSPEDIEEQIEYYLKNNSNKFELIKVPHHGSKNNISKSMIEMVDCEKYLISTNGKKFKHPDKEAIAKILFLGNDAKKIYFNYKPNDIINSFALLGKDISGSIEYKNETVNDKDVLNVKL